MRASTGDAKPKDDPAPDLSKKPKVMLDDDVLTIVASVKMDELGALKKKIEALEAFYNAG